MLSPVSPPESFEAKFGVVDWYDCAVPDACPKHIANGIAEALGVSVRVAAPKHGYLSALQLFDTAEGVQSSRGFVLFDHPKTENVYVSANGPAGGVARHWIKSRFPDHYVKRFDVALDRLLSDRENTIRYNKIVRICEKFKKFYVPVGTKEAGRSLQMNWRKTDALSSRNLKPPEMQAVLYDKGLQKGENPDWRRLELRLRPHDREHSLQASKWEPCDVLGRYEWSKAVVDAYLGSGGEVPRTGSFRVPPEKVADAVLEVRTMKTLEHMLTQYGGMIDTLASIVGPDEAWTWMRRVHEQGDGDGRSALERYQDLYNDLLARAAVRH